MTFGKLLRDISNKRNESNSTLVAMAEEKASESEYKDLYSTFIEAAKIGSHCVVKDKMDVSSQMAKDLENEGITFDNEQFSNFTSFSW